MGKLLFLVLFVIRFAIVRGVICNDDPSLDRDVFEEHGCTCETNSSIIVGQLFALYRQAYDDCYEDDVGDSYTIDCAFSNDENFSNNTTLLNRTMLDRLPVNVSGDAAYENITCLILNGNNITNITNEHMKQFPKLRRLYLDTNQLKKIDDNALMNNTELITLNIANNDLEEVPYLGYLQKLETLNMAHNQLKVMPNISHLVELGRVHLEHNNIQELPPQNFYGLYKLHEFGIHHQHHLAP
ncbi:protein phosphatase 1 regulatory subunit pprA-like isoform X1 [Dysidea avara]|uniref:protein phosphatase 1 regulatory subunit pprA-like isoform X1 n=1 Tax=Dysidea avara TaxID=196820 RepID=UPI0033293994